MAEGGDLAALRRQVRPGQERPRVRAGRRQRRAPRDPPVGVAGEAGSFGGHPAPPPVVPPPPPEEAPVRIEPTDLPVVPEPALPVAEPTGPTVEPADDEAVVSGPGIRRASTARTDRSLRRTCLSTYRPTSTSSSTSRSRGARLQTAAQQIAAALELTPGKVNPCPLLSWPPTCCGACPAGGARPSTPCWPCSASPWPLPTSSASRASARCRWSGRSASRRRLPGRRRGRRRQRQQARRGGRGRLRRGRRPVGVRADRHRGGGGRRRRPVIRRT